MDDYFVSDKYRKIAEKVISEHDDLSWLSSMVKIDCVSSLKEKKSKGRLIMGECLKIKDLYKVYIPYDFLIIIYEPNIAGLSEAQLEILLYHELLHIDVKEDDDSLKYAVRPHDIEEFKTIIDKYGMEWEK